MYHWTYRTAAYSPHIIIDDGGVNVEPAPTYVAPVRLLAKVRPIVQPTAPPPTVIQSQPNKIFWTTTAELSPVSAKKGSGSVCLIILVVIILVIICCFLGLMFLFEAHRQGQQGQVDNDAEEERHCYMPHLMGNGICEREVMYDSRCQYDAQDCKLNKEKEEIAAMICAAIRLRLKDTRRSTDCQHYYYKKHPYCEPCGKLDKSWSYLIDELKVTAGKWLKKEPAIQPEEPTTTIKGTICVWKILSLSEDAKL